MSDLLAKDFDYTIVGAHSAGCVRPERLEF